MLNESPPVTADDEVAALATRLLSRLDDIVDNANVLISAQLDSYHRLVPDEDLATSGRNVITFVLRRLAGAGSLDEAIATAVERGRRRQAQGVALEDVLRAVRLDFAALWKPVVDESGRSRDGSETSAVAMLRIWESLDEIMLALTEGYRYEEALQDGQLLARRARVLVNLIHEAAHDQVSLEHAADILAIDIDAPLLVAAVRLGEGEESRLEMRWRSLGSSAHVTAIGDCALGITPWTRHNRQALEEMVRGHPERRAVLAPPAEGLAGIHAAATIARAALSGAPAGRVSQASKLLVDAVVAHQASVAVPLSKVVLSGLFALPEAERERLLETLDGWLTVEGTSADIAEHLHRHRNTVINHLRRIEEVTGLSLSRPAEAAVVVTALKASRHWRG